MEKLFFYYYYHHRRHHRTLLLDSRVECLFPCLSAFHTFMKLGIITSGFCTLWLIRTCLFCCLAARMAGWVLCGGHILFKMMIICKSARWQLLGKIWWLWWWVEMMKNCNGRAMYTFLIIYCCWACSSKSWVEKPAQGKFSTFFARRKRRQKAGGVETTGWLR